MRHEDSDGTLVCKTHLVQIYGVCVVTAGFFVLFWLYLQSGLLSTESLMNL